MKTNCYVIIPIIMLSIIILIISTPSDYPQTMPTKQAHEECKCKKIL